MKGVDGGTTYFLVPNYEGWNMLKTCVSGIEKNVGCLEPQILVLYESEKVGLKAGGFTGACNKLLKMVLSDPTLHGVYIVGNDTEVITPDFHHKVLSYAEEHPDVGAIMFAERIPGDDVSRIPGGTDWFSIKAANTKGELEEVLHLFDPIEIIYPMLAFTWISGRALRQVGILDERFSPGYYDDFDWGVRAWLKGFKSMWVPWLQFNHGRGVTMGKLYPDSGAEGAKKFYEKYPYLTFGQTAEDALQTIKDTRERWTTWEPLTADASHFVNRYTHEIITKEEYAKRFEKK